MTYVTITYDDPDKLAEPDANLHGGKGAGLLAMAKAKLPVPEAVILTTKAWKHYRDTGELPQEVGVYIKAILEDFPGAMFSVRSGAPVSMPGMMDTVLNVGVDPSKEVYPDSFSRFARGWLEIVHGIHKDRVSELFSEVRAKATPSYPDGVPHRGRMNGLIAGVIQRAEGLSIPSNRYDQVVACVRAVFDSWDTPRAIAYRKMHGIPETMGTACVVQRMVMGTAPGLSGSGVMFSRNPATGEPVLTGEIAFNAQGEEVVSGAVTPIYLSKLEAPGASKAHQDLSGKLVGLAIQLEHHFGDVQDIEFTVEHGHLYVLQTRLAKMSARARIVTALDLSQYMPLPERFVFVKTRVTKAMVEETKKPKVATSTAPLLTGLAASPGAVSGQVVFRTTPLHKIDKNCILVAVDTSPDDFSKMAASGAILTSTGGFTCHSAVVARGIGVPAVVGSPDLCFNISASTFLMGGQGPVKEGDWITLDGASGHAWLGQLPVKADTPPAALFDLLRDYQKTQQDGAYQFDLEANRVAIKINVLDLDACAKQIEQGTELIEAGRDVAYQIKLLAVGEDMFNDGVEQILAELSENFGADLAGCSLLGNPTDKTDKKIATFLGMHFPKTPVKVMGDPLDLLD